MKAYAHLRGFTLLEILICLFILAIVGMAITSGLHMAVKVDDALEKKSKLLSELQLAIIMMTNDMQQIINRPIIDELGQESAPVLLSENSIELTHAGYINPFAMDARSTLQRVAYQFEDSHLLRITWHALDRTLLNRPDKQILLNQVKSFHVAIFPANNPLTNLFYFLSLHQNTQYVNMNIAIEVEMEIAGLGYVKRIIPLNNRIFRNFSKKNVMPEKVGM